MVGKVTQPGNSFDDVTEYIYNGRVQDRKANEKRAMIIDTSPDLIHPIDAKDKEAINFLKAQFKTQSETYKNFDTNGRYVGHHVLSFSQEEIKNLTADKMKEFTNSYLKLMNLNNTQYFAVTHNDTDHKHVHIIFNRVQNNGKLYNTHNEKLRSSSAVVAILLGKNMHLEPGQKQLAKSKEVLSMYCNFENIHTIRKENRETLGTARNKLHLEKICEQKGIDFKEWTNQKGDTYFNVGKEYFKEADMNASFKANRDKPLKTPSNGIIIAKPETSKQSNSIGSIEDFLSNNILKIKQPDDFKPFIKKKKINGLARKKEKIASALRNNKNKSQKI